MLSDRTVIDHAACIAEFNAIVAAGDNAATAHEHVFQQLDEIMAELIAEDLDGWEVLSETLHWWSILDYRTVAAS